MSNLKEIRRRIQSINSIIQLTKAMKIVSVLKLKKSRDSLSHIHPYIKKIEDLLIEISYKEKLNNFNFFKENKNQPKLIIAIGSNKGFCSRINNSIVQEIIYQMNSSNTFTPYLFTIGKKVKDLLNNKFKIEEDHSILFNPISYNKIDLFSDILIKKFFKKSFHSIHLIYNSFKNLKTQKIISKQILPIKIPIKSLKTPQTYYLLEPSKISIINKLIIQSIKIHIFIAILESFTVENIARINSMQQATDNACELKNELFFTYNKNRQTSITKEILEIIGGVESLISEK